MLTPTLQSPSDLINKLDRELWRAIHHRHMSHKADHFYNFCVTALAMKDHFFEAKGIIDHLEKAPYFKIWNSISELVAITEIANSSKHFVLRERKKPQILSALKTKSVVSSTSEVVHVFANERDEFRFQIEADAPDISVKLFDERILGLYEFMESVSKYWKDFLRSENIVLLNQSSKELHGVVE